MCTCSYSRFENVQDMNSSGNLSWDVFCRVVDNYGDAAVSWRLARQLAVEYGFNVRLWVDSLRTLHALRPEVDSSANLQIVDGVRIQHWQTDADFQLDDGMEVADIAVDAFGGGLPPGYVAAMARRQPAPLWIILEYLSAESWVSSHHGLASPHPSLPIQRYFFFPGYGSSAGGLLCEAGLATRRDVFQRDAGLRSQFWRDIGFELPLPDATVISLFGYESVAVAKFLGIWSHGGGHIVVAVPESRLRPQVLAFLGEKSACNGDTFRRGNLDVRFVPFLSQDRYDHLLWACDWNFVRGEDSFVRAQWAARPLVWHIYPQEGHAHWPKLDAFLDRYCSGLDSAVIRAFHAIWHAWNGSQDMSLAVADWDFLQKNQQVLRTHALNWARITAAPGDLTANLVQFCKSKVK